MAYGTRLVRMCQHVAQLALVATLLSPTSNAFATRENAFASSQRGGIVPGSGRHNTRVGLQRRMVRHRSKQTPAMLGSPALNGLVNYWSSYSDLSAVSAPVNTCFLLTNAAYFAAGVKILDVRPESVLGNVMIFSGLVSCLYHGTQVVCGPRSRVVVTSLFIDYIGAFTAMATTLHRLGSLVCAGRFPLRGIGLGAAAMFTFFKGAQWDAGIRYVVWHSLWHFLSAAAVVMIALK